RTAVDKFVQRRPARAYQRRHGGVPLRPLRVVERGTERREVLLVAVQDALADLRLHGTVATAAGPWPAGTAEHAVALLPWRGLARALPLFDRGDDGVEGGLLRGVQVQRGRRAGEVFGHRAAAAASGRARRFARGAFVRRLVAQRRIGDLEHVVALADLDLGVHGQPRQQGAVAV